MNVELWAGVTHVERFLSQDPDECLLHPVQLIVNLVVGEGGHVPVGPGVRSEGM